MSLTRSLLRCLLLPLLTLAVPQAALAAWPERAVTVVVPFAAGGNVDVTARIAAEHLQRRLGVPFVVENAVGGAGVVGAQRVARAAPDGYTLLWAPMPVLAVTPHLHKLSFDMRKDLAPISLVSYTPFFITVAKSFPANSLEELVAYVKARPKQVLFGSAGPGSGTQLSAAAFARRAGLDMVEVSYRGSAPAFADMLGGQIHMMSATPTEVEPFMVSGKIKVLGISTPQRSKRNPDIPAIAELFPGHRVLSWVGMLAPAGTPQPIIDLIAKELMDASKRPEFAARLGKMGQDPETVTPAEFARIIDTDFREMQDLVRALGLKVQ